MPKIEIPDRYKDLLRVYLSDTRIEIINLIQDHELNRTELAERVGITPQGVDKHVKRLSDLGLIRKKKLEGRSGEPILILPTERLLSFTGQLKFLLSMHSVQDCTKKLGGGVAGG